jgi:D-3-phosphoglycerate dehydrogenase
LDALREEEINVEEMQNSIFEGDSAACCTLQLSQAPSQSLLGQLARHADVLQIHLEAR